MSKAAISELLVGIGFEILFFTLEIKVKSMPTIIAILGYIVGAGLIIYGILGMFHKKKPLNDIQNIQKPPDDAMDFLGLSEYSLETSEYLL